MINKIITYIKQNRVSTTEIADCMGKSGVLENTNILNKGHFKVGKIHYCYADNESNWNVHKYIQEIEESSIVFVDDLGSKDRGIFGDIVSKYLLLYKQSSAIITNGNIRDAHNLVKENYPIWCKGVNPVGCFNKEPQYPVDNLVLKKRQEYFENAIGVCDDTGVVIITKEYINNEFYEKLEWIEKQEDIWFDCIDRKKMNTFEAICLKQDKR